jgi:hypothetical protein
MHHFAQLLGNQAVQFGHPGIERGRQVLGHDNLALEHLIDQFADNVARPVLFMVGLSTRLSATI